MIKFQINIILKYQAYVGVLIYINGGSTITYNIYTYLYIFEIIVFFYVNFFYIGF